MDVPGPPTHQAIISKPVHFEEAFKSFNVGATRFPAINKVISMQRKFGFMMNSHLTERYLALGVNRI